MNPFTRLLSLFIYHRPKSRPATHTCRRTYTPVTQIAHLTLPCNLTTAVQVTTVLHGDGFTASGYNLYLN